MILYLNVPFEEINEAKKLGARWNQKNKTWYIDTPRENYHKYSRWILSKCAEAIIPHEYIYIIEGTRTCWKCGKETTVIGFGVGDYTHIYKDDDIVYQETIETPYNADYEIHLSWVKDETKIPPSLLKYIKENYSVKTGYSHGCRCFANHCNHCSALQGNNYVFDESGNPLDSCAFGQQLITKMQQIKIKEIEIEEDVILDWQVRFCPNDYAYLKYGRLEELHLSSNPNYDCITYAELYCINS